MSRATHRTHPATLVLPFVAAIALGACSSTPSGDAGGNTPAATAPGPDASSAGQGSGTTGGGSGGAASAPDPCAALTTADVQPFFTVKIATKLPSANPFTCEWSAGDAPLGASTTMDVYVQGGDDAALRWQFATTGGTRVMFSGVGDQAEHAPGAPDFLAIHDGIECGITTLGWQHLVGKADYEPGNIPDAAATAIAQNYGTLCNRIFGTGNTTPLVAAAPPSDAGSSGTPRPSVAIPAVAGTFGSGVPLPVGVDCTGSHLTTDLSGAPECDTLTSGDPAAIYPFYLQALPAAGFTIHSERDGVTSDGTEVASVMFGGNGISDFSTINLWGLKVTITLPRS